MAYICMARTLSVALAGVDLATSSLNVEGIATSLHADDPCAENAADEDCGFSLLQTRLAKVSRSGEAGSSVGMSGAAGREAQREAEIRAVAAARQFTVVDAAEMLRTQIAKFKRSKEEEEAMRTFKVDEQRATTTWAPAHLDGVANGASFRSLGSHAVLPDGARLSAEAPADLELALDTVAIDADTEFSRHTGIFPPGHELLRKTLSLDKAQRWCANLPGCQGFSFEGNEQSGTARVIFKGGEDPIEKSDWTHFVKNAPRSGEETAYDVKPGMLIGGADLHTEVMTLRNAASWCSRSADCIGFTFAGRNPEATEEVKMYFKGYGAADAASDNWTSYRLDVLGLTNLRSRDAASHLMPGEDNAGENEQAHSDLASRARQSDEQVEAKKKNTTHLFGSSSEDVAAGAPRIASLTSSGATNLEKLAAAMTQDVPPREMDALANSIAAAKVDASSSLTVAAKANALTGQFVGAEQVGEAVNGRMPKPAAKSLAAVELSSVEVKSTTANTIPHSLGEMNVSAARELDEASRSAAASKNVLTHMPLAAEAHEATKALETDMPAAGQKDAASPLPNAGSHAKLMRRESQDEGLRQLEAATVEFEAAFGGNQSHIDAVIAANTGASSSPKKEQDAGYPPIAKEAIDAIATSHASTEAQVAKYPPTAKEAIEAAANLASIDKPVATPKSIGQMTDELARSMDQELQQINAAAESADEDLQDLDVRAQALKPPAQSVVPATKQSDETSSKLASQSISSPKDAPASVGQSQPVATALPARLTPDPQQTLHALEADLSSLEASADDVQAAFEDSQEEFMAMMKDISQERTSVDPHMLGDMDHDLTQLEADSAVAEQTIDEEKAVIASLARARQQAADPSLDGGRFPTAAAKPVAARTVGDMDHELRSDTAAVESHVLPDENLVIVRMPGAVKDASHSVENGISEIAVSKPVVAPTVEDMNRELRQLAADATAAGQMASDEAVMVNEARARNQGTSPSLDGAVLHAEKPVSNSLVIDMDHELRQLESDATAAEQMAGDEQTMITRMASAKTDVGPAIRSGDSDDTGSGVLAKKVQDMAHELAQLEADTAAAQESAEDQQMLMAGMASARVHEATSAADAHSSLDQEAQRAEPSAVASSDVDRVSQLAAEMAALEASIADAEAGLGQLTTTAPAAAAVDGFVFPDLASRPTVQPLLNLPEAAPAARTLDEMSKALAGLDGSATDVEAELAESEDALTQMMQKATDSGANISLAAIRTLDDELAHLEDDSENVDTQIQEQKALIQSLARSGTASAATKPAPTLNDMVRELAQLEENSASAKASLEAMQPPAAA